MIAALLSGTVLAVPAPASGVITAGVVGNAILQNPEAFANALQTVGGIGWSQAEAARRMALNMVPEHAIIINKSRRTGTWFTYNDVAPFKFYTQFQSYMGPGAIVEVNTLGWGAMQTFLNNKNPPFTVTRNSIYVYDGISLSKVMYTSIHL